MEKGLYDEKRSVWTFKDGRIAANQQGDATGQRVDG